MIPIQSLGLGLYPKSIMDIAAEPKQVPVFEIHSGGKQYKIYADGQIEGFDSPAVVINRIPMLARIPA